MTGGPLIMNNHSCSKTKAFALPSYYLGNNHCISIHVATGVLTQAPATSEIKSNNSELRYTEIQLHAVFQSDCNCNPVQYFQIEDLYIFRNLNSDRVNFQRSRDCNFRAHAMCMQQQSEEVVANGYSPPWCAVAIGWTLFQRCLQATPNAQQDPSMHLVHFP